MILNMSKSDKNKIVLDFIKKEKIPILDKN